MDEVVSEEKSKAGSDSSARANSRCAADVHHQVYMRACLLEALDFMQPTKLGSSISDELRR